MPVPEEPRCIVVGVDGSLDSAAALEWAMLMARGMDAEVVAVFGFDLPPPIPSLYPELVAAPVDPAWRADLESAFETDWTAPLRDSGIRYRTVFKDGRPASVILQAADDVGADVIVVGRRGRGGFAELVLGSVGHEVVLHSRRPVLLIPPPSHVHAHRQGTRGES